MRLPTHHLHRCRLGSTANFDRHLATHSRGPPSIVASEEGGLESSSLCHLSLIPRLGCRQSLRLPCRNQHTLRLLPPQRLLENLNACSKACSGRRRRVGENRLHALPKLLPLCCLRHEPRGHCSAVGQLLLLYSTHRAFGKPSRLCPRRFPFRPLRLRRLLLRLPRRLPVCLTRRLLRSELSAVHLLPLGKFGLEGIPIALKAGTVEDALRALRTPPLLPPLLPPLVSALVSRVGPHCCVLRFDIAAVAGLARAPQI